MFTPQEIQEQTFSKAVFGGYDMQQVDDFLEPLTEDYIMLYKEKFRAEVQDEDSGRKARGISRPGGCHEAADGAGAGTV